MSGIDLILDISRLAVSIEAVGMMTIRIGAGKRSGCLSESTMLGMPCSNTTAVWLDQAETGFTRLSEVPHRSQAKASTKSTKGVILHFLLEEEYM